MGRDGGRHRMATRREAHEDTSTGCMCAVFQLFDFQVPLNQHHSSRFLPGDPFLQRPPVNTSTGVEASRTSLESKELMTTLKEQENLVNFPAGLRIKTRVSSCGSNSRTEDMSTECSAIISPGTKTPNLVARLMGLDLLPECSSRSPSFSSSHSGPCTKSLRKDGNLLSARSRRSFYEDDAGIGVRSLPATPRMSSARRSDSDYHRLSLQMNGENIKEEFKLPAKIRARGKRSRQQVQDENRSPGHYAKQIVKQIKESVSRRVGLDITNINRDKHQDARRDKNLISPFKPAKKIFRDSPKLGDKTSHDGKQSATPSCSPKLRFFDTGRNRPAANLGTKSPRTSTSSDNHQSPGNPNPSKQKFQVTMKDDNQQRDTKKSGSENSCSSVRKVPHQTYDRAIRKKKEEPYVHSASTNKANFMDKKSKKAPLSTELLSTSGHVLLPVKKHPSPPATKLPQKQAQVSSKTSHSYKLLHLQSDKIFTVVDAAKTSRCATTASSSAAEYRYYIQWILNRSGIADNVTPMNLGIWRTTSHPLDPSIFYYLELFKPSSALALSRRCNRKLIFQLVDELLVDILRPRLHFRPRICFVPNNLSLIDELCNKIESFPAANCQVSEDIDNLIGRDLGKLQLIGHFEDEWEGIVCEIEGDIMDSLVREAAALVGGGAEE